MDTNFPLNTTDNNPDPLLIKPDDKTGNEILSPPNDLQTNDLQKQINKEINTEQPLENADPTNVPSQTIPTPVIPPSPPPNFSSGNMPKKSGGKNIFALAGVFVLLLILIPTIVFFGVKKQQSTTGRAADSLCKSGQFDCGQFKNPPDANAESTCYTHAGSGCDWRPDANQPHWIGQCYCVTTDKPTPTPGGVEVTGEMTCSAGKNGVKVVNNTNVTTTCSGTYASCQSNRASLQECQTNNRCAGGPNRIESFSLTAGQSSQTWGSVQISCGAWQTDITITCDNGKSCSNAANDCEWNETTCNNTPTPTPTTTQQTGQCQAVKIYNANNQIITDLTTIRSGQVVNLAVLGSSSGFDRGRFRVNNGLWLPSADGTVQTNQNNEFFYEYTVPAGINNFKIEAMVHHASLGWK